MFSRGAPCICGSSRSLTKRQWQVEAAALRNGRRLSYLRADRQGQGGFSAAHNSTLGQRGTSQPSRYSNEDGPGIRVGRYSRKPLDPKQLLQQAELDDENVIEHVSTPAQEVGAQESAGQLEHQEATADEAQQQPTSQHFIKRLIPGRSSPALSQTPAARRDGLVSFNQRVERRGRGETSPTTVFRPLMQAGGKTELDSSKVLPPTNDISPRSTQAAFESDVDMPNALPDAEDTQLPLTQTAVKIEVDPSEALPGAEDTSLPATHASVESDADPSIALPHAEDMPLPTKDDLGEIENLRDVEAPHVKAHSELSTQDLRFLKQLRRATDQQKPKLAERTYREMKSTGSAELRVYQSMLLTCTSLRLPELAVKVWTLMEKSGLKPTVRTWTIMIRMAARMSDKSAVRTLWSSMRSSGVVPDAAAWSALVFTLITTGSSYNAMSALEEMGREWSSYTGRPTRDGNSTPPAEPNIGVVNAAITAYCSGGSVQENYVAKVLAWAATFDLQPDIVTYNVMINIAMRRNDIAGGMRLLGQMASRDIKPNSQTLTILLTKLFWSTELTNLDMQAQTEYLLAFIDDLERNHIKMSLDEKGYALAIDRMLRTHNNDHAAKALLDRMRGQGVKATPHIYTILLTNYLKSDPPKYAAVDSLWADIRFGNKGHQVELDSIFCDRALELFSPHHREIGMSKIDELLQQVTAEGKRPSWPALHAVAKALVERGEMGRLAKLVDDVRFSRGVSSFGVAQSYGRLDFWNFIFSTGVMQEKGITKLEQVISA